MPRNRLPRTTQECERSGCSQTFEKRSNAADASRRYCSRSCARQVENTARSQRKQEEWYASDESLCACGVNRLPYETRASVKYCSAECRKLYGKPKPRDPSKWVTFNCQNCGEEVTRYKGYGNGAHKYCSNECAQKHTKVKQHIVVEDAVVLDSPWEALFWGLCSFYKLSVERYDREHAVEWAPGCWYAPDFWLPTERLAVEVKGWEDDEDQQRWEAFTRDHDLIVIGRGEMETLMRMSDSSTVAGNLLAMARSRGIAQIIKP